MKAKLLLQTLSRKRLGWDDLLEDTDRMQWKRWLDDLPKLQEIQVDRCSSQRNSVKLKKYSHTSSQILLVKDMQPLHTSV